MKPFITLLTLLILVSSGAVSAQEQQEVPYTLADRDRIIRVEAKMEALETKMEALETKMEALETKMDVKFDSVQRQLDQLITLFYWGFGILLTLFIFIMAYLIWDRRTALKPALDKASAADDKSVNLLRAIRDYSRNHPDLAEILKTHGLL